MSIKMLVFFLTKLFHSSLLNESPAIRLCLIIEVIRKKSNQIKSLLLSHHHSTSALVSEILTSVLQTVQKNNNLHMDSTYLQTVQKTMCKIHIHILSTHSVL